jgi:hypothetical protein
LPLQLLECLGVDSNDDDVVGAFGPPQLEAGLQGPSLEPVERAARLHRSARDEGHGRHAGEYP